MGAYSGWASKTHTLFHSKPPATQYTLNCSKQNCKWTFQDKWKLQQHENVHNNILLSCIYCPYTCVAQWSLTSHQREHFNIRGYKCDYCSATFKSQGYLNAHFKSQHSGIKTKCFICDYESNVNNVHNHLIRKHKLFGY